MFALRENGSTCRRGTTTGSCGETSQLQQDVAHNFSRDWASLHGHLKRKQIDGLAKRANNNVQLDANQLLLDLMPPAKRTVVLGGRGGISFR